MSFLRLCDDDPLLSTLRDVFDCHPIGVPDERVLPLTVVASDGSKSRFRGALSPLLVGAPVMDVPIAFADMSNLSLKRTNAIKTDLGLKILEGFLSGFGLPSAGIKASFSGATKLSFAFKEVRRQYIDVNLLGRRLATQRLDLKNPAASIFGEGGYEFLLLDSVIQSRDFMLSVESNAGARFSVDIPALQEIVQKADAGISIDGSTQKEVFFRGPKHLTFAFACVRLFVDANGTITALPPADKVPALKGYLASSPDRIIHYTPDRVLLGSIPALLTFDP